MNYAIFWSYMFKKAIWFAVDIFLAYAVVPILIPTKKNDIDHHGRIPRGRNDRRAESPAKPTNFCKKNYSIVVDAITTGISEKEAPDSKKNTQ